jgi:hypothetical protein
MAERARVPAEGGERGAAVMRLVAVVKEEARNEGSVPPIQARRIGAAA